MIMDVIVEFKKIVSYIHKAKEEDLYLPLSICFLIEYLYDKHEEYESLMKVIKKHTPSCFNNEKINYAYRERIKSIYRNHRALPESHFYFEVKSNNWDLRLIYLDCLIKHLENERDNVLKLEL